MLDRKLQEQLLIKLADKYPSITRNHFLNEFDADEEKVLYNLYYLHEHELISMHTVHVESGRLRLIDRIIITAKGIDFIQNDGGLSAILDTVTVKLHADTIRDLIDAKIVESKSISEQEKPALREALKGMKEEGLKQLTTRLISYGLDQGAITAQQLSQWIPS